MACQQLVNTHALILHAAQWKGHQKPPQIKWKKQSGHVRLLTKSDNIRMLIIQDCDVAASYSVLIDRDLKVNLEW